MASQARQMRVHSVTKQIMMKLNIKLYFRVIFLALLLPLALGDCIDLDLGMKSGSIPDSNITASTEQSAITPAKNGRLNFASGSSWCAATSDSNPYLQIDLQTLHIICAVSTQGNSQADQWVTNYTLQTSTDGSTWIDYREDGQVKYFEGNIDRNSEVKHVLYRVFTRYLRFLPKAHQGSVCMRVEGFGVKQKPENLALGKTATQSSTSSSQNAGNAVDGNSGQCSKTQQGNPSWWRVDLGANLVPAIDIYIVNGFGAGSSVTNTDYNITFGDNSNVANNPVCEGLYSFTDFKASAVCFMNPLKTGRYVGIMTTKSQVLQLCEVEVYSRDNLAFGKPTHQYSGQYNDGKSSKAVDGNSNTHFMYGRPEGSCTSTVITNKPWWRVDLQQDAHVTEVYLVGRGSECGCPDRFKNFEIRVGAESSGTSTANPKCGDTYTDRLPVGEGTSFFCHPSLKGRYVIIRILKTNTPLNLCEVEVYSERRACPMQSIGVASWDAFPRSSFSTSSVSSDNYSSKGRLNGAGAWSPRTDTDPRDYLQIDLKYEFVICAVATQGKPSADDWTEEYKLHLSLDGTNWVTYQENKVDKVFNGNSGRNDIVKQTLKKVVSARFIRFQPTKYNTRKALRVEVYGVLFSTVPSQAPSGFSVSVSSSTSITASWQLPPEYARHGIITGFKLFYKEKDSATTVLTFNNVATLTRVVTGLDNSTIYEFQVLAINSNGDGPKSIIKAIQTVEDVPSQAPSSFSVIAKSSTIITASWQLPPENARNGVIRGFKLFYKKKSSAALPTNFTINSGSVHTQDITGLDEYTEYEFQVLAFTSVGDGPKSSAKAVRTKEDVPSAAPTSFSVTAITSTSVTASWQLPPVDHRNGIITGYKLLYTKKGPGNLPITVPINSGSTFTKVVIGLEKYTEYEFQVLAFTSVGDGPKSNVKVERTKEDVPSQAPSIITTTATSSTSILVSWQLPPKTSNNGVIRGFKLFFKKKGSAVLPTSLVVNSGLTLTKDVTGLDKYTEYEFQVLAFTSVGDGPKSSIKVQRTKEDVPSQPPSSFSVTAKTSTSIEASWQLPPADHRNGIITGFKLFYKKKGSADSSTTVTINDGSIRKRTFYGLAKYTEYEFQMLAFTSVGDGPNSSVETVRTKEDVPSQAPSNFAVNAKSSTSVTTSWQLPPKLSWNGIIRGFKLFYTKKGSGDSPFIVLINSGTTLTKFVVGLAKYTEYEFQVLAFTSVGDGPNSTVKVERTMEDAPDAPVAISYIDIPPSEPHGPKINLTWSRPAESNGIIRSYSVFYSHNGDTKEKSLGRDVLNYIIDVLGGVTYQFHVQAVTIKPGPNVTLTVNTKEYEPSLGPKKVHAIEVNTMKYQIAWTGLSKEVANGIVLMYQVRIILKENCTLVKSEFNSTINVTATDVILSGLSVCARYEVSVRGYTVAGPGPYSNPKVLQTLGLKWSKETPYSLSFSPVSSETGITAKITLPRFPRSAKFFQVIIITFSSNYSGVVNSPDRFTPQDLLTYEEAHKSPSPAAYVAFQFDGNDFNTYQDFIVGNEAQSNSKTGNKESSDVKSFINKPLQSYTKYRVFLRAFVTEMVYVSSNFIEIETKEKPDVKKLPERTILSAGEQVNLTCEVTGDPAPDVTWTKNGSTNIPRAQFKNDGHILVIKNVIPEDSGFYECKALNKFGESHTATAMEVTETCSTPWTALKERCYLVIESSPRRWRDAYAKCVNLGSQMVTITSEEENQFIGNIVKVYLKEKKLEQVQVWLGLRKPQVKAQFQWVDGSTLEGYTNWAPQEPNNAHGRELCSEMLVYDEYWLNTWNDVYCGGSAYKTVTVCEKPL